MILVGKTAPTTSSSAAPACSTRPKGVDAVLDVRVDGGTISQLGTGARRERPPRDRRRRARARAGVHRPARAPAHAGARGRGDDRVGHRGRGGRRLLRDPRDAEHRPRRRLDRPAPRAAGPSGARRRRCRSGSRPRSRSARTGTQLTEMGELADAGAAAFTDDGRPVASAGLMRRALEYNAITGRPLALHCEEPSLTRGGHMHMGVVSAELGLGGWPSLGESLGVARELSLGGDTGQPVHLMHLSAHESVELLRRAQAAGVTATAEVTPHHLSPDRRGGALARPEPEDEPAAPDRGGPARADRRAPRRDDRRRRDRPRAALARGEGRAVRGRAVRGDRPRDGVRRALHDARRARRDPARDAPRAHVRRARRGSSASSGRGSPSARRRTSSS